MSTSINGHTLTPAQVRVLDIVRDYMRRHAGDSWLCTGPNVSPKGDGREVPVTEIFPHRGNQFTADRTTLYRLNLLGVLRACEITCDRGMLKAEPQK